ncbi:Hypothetical protein D9617_2g054140 [Elsinoe fawcettii]|nr:Hypothetical protein D9617_2g054140 [Elsinoe fawcettii]
MSKWQQTKATNGKSANNTDELTIKSRWDSARQRQTQASKIKLVCNNSDVATIKAAVKTPQVFCTFYLSKIRNVTPFTAMGYARTTAACRCIRQSAGKTTKAATPTPSVCSNAKCRQSDIAAIKAEFKKPLQICKFFVALKGTQTAQLMDSQTLARSKAACQAIIKAASAPTTTPKVASSSKSSSKASKAPSTTTTSVVSPSTSSTSSATTLRLTQIDPTKLNILPTSSNSTTVVTSTAATTSATSTITSTTTTQKITTFRVRSSSTTLATTSTDFTTTTLTSSTSSPTTTDVPSSSSEDESGRGRSSTTDDSFTNTSTGQGKLKASPTPSIPFCSSAAVSSLQSDPSGTSFCQIVLVVPTVTVTTRTTSTTTTSITITNTNIAFETSITTREITMPPNLTETAYITAYATFCGGGNTFRKRDAEPAQATSAGIDVPTYLSGLPVKSISSACSCLGPLPTPSVTRTSTIRGPTVTITSMTDIDLTSTIIKTLTTVSYANTSSIPTVTATTTVTDTAAVTAGAVATNTLAPSVPGVFMKYPGYTPADNIPALISCQCSSSSGGTCDFAGYMSPLIAASTCADWDGCMATCAYFNTKVSSNKCSGVFYDADVGFCTLLGPDYLPMVDSGSCGVMGNATAGGFAALIRN